MLIISRFELLQAGLDKNRIDTILPPNKGPSVLTKEELGIEDIDGFKKDLKAFVQEPGVELLEFSDSSTTQNDILNLRFNPSDLSSVIYESNNWVCIGIETINQNIDYWK